MRLRYYLLFDRIKIENANAISSPITYGFPAITGFLGAIHALSRKIPVEKGIRLNGVLIACHQCDIKAYRPHNSADYSFNQARHPIKKDGKTAAIIEEGKLHLEVSLVVEVLTENKGILRNDEEQQEFLNNMQQLIMQQRMAGGSIQKIQQAKLYNCEDSAQIIKSLLPAFVLIEAKQDLIDITQELQKDNHTTTALDALIETATLHHEPQANDKWQTKSIKTGRGWIIPIPVGYQGISSIFEPNTLVSCRTTEYPSQYVECLYSLGKWVFPYRLKETFSNSFWRYQQPQQNLYLVTQILD